MLENDLAASSVAWHTDDTETNTISRTSMAASHVAGAAALYLETHSTESAQAVRDALNSFTTKRIMPLSKTANNHLLFSLEVIDSGSGDGVGGERALHAQVQIRKIQLNC